MSLQPFLHHLDKHLHRLKDQDVKISNWRVPETETGVVFAIAFSVGMMCEPNWLQQSDIKSESVTCVTIPTRTALVPLQTTTPRDMTADFSKITLSELVQFESSL